jgi:hypothetical protein
MDVLSSARFRTTYAKLVKETLVTVNGHPIGRWTPIATITPVLHDPDGVVDRLLDPENTPVGSVAPTYSTVRSFGGPRPAPKPTRK